MRGKKQGPYQPIRKWDRSRAEIILRVKQFFEREREQNQRMIVNRVIERIMAATGAGRKIILQVKDKKDL